MFNRSNISFFLIDRRTTEDFDFISEEEKKNSVTGIEYNLASADSKWNGRAFFHKSFTEGLDDDDMISGMKENEYANDRMKKVLSESTMVLRPH